MKAEIIVRENVVYQRVIAERDALKRNVCEARGFSWVLISMLQNFCKWLGDSDSL